MIRVAVPGSKSITARALVVAALAKGRSVLSNALESDDTQVMKKALSQLGVRIKKNGIGYWVLGTGLLKSTKKPLFCGNAGTAMRFLTAMLATQGFTSIITGSQRMQNRPIGDLVDALRQLGATILYRSKNGFPPLEICGPLNGDSCKLSGKISSQFLSGLLLAAPRVQKSVTIHVNGELVSEPYVDITIDVMKSFGVRVSRRGYKRFFIKAPQHYKARKFFIEGDASSASYFWGISALTGEPIQITNVPITSHQADIEFLKILKKHFSHLLQSTTIRYCPPLSINCSDFPDSAMTLAVLSAFVPRITTLTGLANLRVKECDRLHALATELKKIGCRVEKLTNGLRIYGNPIELHGALINAYNDHRMAMCFGMAGFVIPEITVNNPNCVSKTYPNFWRDLAALKKQFREKNIILTGMRGSGKTELGKRLAHRLRRLFIDIDQRIEKIAKTSISELVRKKGWREFRALERRVIRSLHTVKGTVISTGGGTLMYKPNVTHLKKNGKIFFLDVPTAVLKKRLQAKRDRPSLTGAQFLDELDAVYKKRHPRYRTVADMAIDGSSQKFTTILRIMSRFGLI